MPMLSVWGIGSKKCHITNANRLWNIFDSRKSFDSSKDTIVTQLFLRNKKRTVCNTLEFYKIPGGSNLSLAAQKDQRVLYACSPLFLCRCSTWPSRPLPLWNYSAHIKQRINCILKAQRTGIKREQSHTHKSRIPVRVVVYSIKSS